MRSTVRRLLSILLVCLLVPGLSLSETFNDSAKLPAFSLADYPATTSASAVTIRFTGADGYAYVLEHQYKGVWLAPLSLTLSGKSGAFQAECLPGTNKFVLRNFGQSRKASNSITFTIKSTDKNGAPGTVTMTTPTLRLGSKGPAVKALHQALKDLGVYDGPLSTTFTTATRKAVIAAQKMFSITQDGVAGPKTLHVLDLETYTVDASSLDSSGSSGTSYLKKGSKGSQVLKLQKRLIALGYNPGKADGIFGDLTLAAVLKYQKNAKLYQDGIVGPDTWAKLNEGSASLIDNPSGYTRLMKLGSKGSDVKAVQTRLIALGYLAGKADGVFGKLTRSAVVAFQFDQEIKVDGIVGPVTYGKLFP